MTMAIADLPVILFVPGSRPERFDKAVASGAPAIVIDLEDAVAPAEKDQARAAAATWFARRGPGTVLAGVRLNSPYGRDGLQDLLALRDAPWRLDFAILPKVESPFEVMLAHRHLGSVPLICTVESALGLSQAIAIATAAPIVASLGFGGVDLAADLRATFSWDALLTARGALVLAAAAAKVGAMDVPCLDLNDEAGLAAECRQVRAMGFTGKFAIHPRQVAGILEAFTPSAEERSRAEAILAAAERAGGAAAEVDGRMVDEAVLRSARRIVALARMRAEARRA